MHPAASIAAIVLGKPATMITFRGLVGRTLSDKPLEAANSSAGATIMVIPRALMSW